MKAETVGAGAIATGSGTEEDHIDSSPAPRDECNRQERPARCRGGTLAATALVTAGTHPLSRHCCDTMPGRLGERLQAPAQFGLVSHASPPTARPGGDPAPSRREAGPGPHVRDGDAP